MTALPVQAAPDVPPSWALHNEGGLIPVDLDQMQSYRIQAVAGQDIGLPGPTPATARKIVTIAIFDTGLDASHPAFAKLLARTDTSTPRLAASGENAGYSDTDGSGTHLAGIVASISQDIVIIPMQVLQRASNAPVKPHLIDAVSERMGVDAVSMQELSQRVAAAIRSLADRSVQLMLLPFGWPRTADTDPVAAAIAEAQARGVLLVAAAGNDASTTLPVPCQLSGVICVAASRPDGAIASFSNIGPGVDIAAPGVEIPGPIPVGRRSIRQPGYAYDNRSGTSQAAAMVAGAAALLLSRGIPAADVYPRLVLGARSVLPETRVIEGPINTSGHAVDSLDPHDIPLRSGQLDIAAALALPARTLILPANKEVKAIAWDGVAKTVALELALKNVWESSPAAHFAITIRPAGDDTVLPSATIDRASFNGNWLAQQEKRFAIHCHFAGVHWYARDAHHLLRVSFFNRRAHHFGQHMIAPTRAALDIPIAVTGAFQSERQSAAFVNTVHELQYHDFKTGQIATSRLNAYSFLGEHRYIPQQFPIVIRDVSKHTEGRPALLIAAGQGEYSISLPAMTQAGKGNHIISPARWHLRSSADCKALEEPVFLPAQSVYALDFFCGDRILRIAFAD